MQLRSCRAGERRADWPTMPWSSYPRCHNSRSSKRLANPPSLEPAAGRLASLLDRCVRRCAAACARCGVAYRPRMCASCGCVDSVVLSEVLINLAGTTVSKRPRTHMRARANKLHEHVHADVHAHVCAVTERPAFESAQNAARHRRLDLSSFHAPTCMPAKTLPAQDQGIPTSRQRP